MYGRGKAGLAGGATPRWQAAQKAHDEGHERASARVSVLSAAWDREMKVKHA